MNGRSLGDVQVSILSKPEVGGQSRCGRQGAESAEQAGGLLRFDTGLTLQVVQHTYAIIADVLRKDDRRFGGWSSREVVRTRHLQ